MVSIMRCGPEILVASPKSDDFETSIATLGEFTGFTEAFDALGEHDTILLLARDVKGTVRFDAVESVFAFRGPASDLLSRIISSGAAAFVDRIRPSPRFVLVRTFGDKLKVIESAKADLGAAAGDPIGLFDAYDKGSIVCFTGKSLALPIAWSDVDDLALHVPTPYTDTMRALSFRLPRYVREGMGGREWSDIAVKVFDRYRSYELQLERIRFVMAALDLAFVAGESWDVDRPRFMMTIDVYRIRFMTMLEPAAFKRIMLGLEYAADGTRMGDYDVFTGEDDKVHWSDADKEKSRDRKTLGMACRAEVLAGLTPEGRARLDEYDARLLATRTD